MPAFLCILIVALLFPSSLFAQGKEEMEERRKNAQKKIEEISQILSQTTQDRYSGLDQLKAINRQMFQRRELLIGIQEELVFTQEEIKETGLVIAALERDLKGLMEEYKLMVYQASKSADSFQKLSFLFSSKSFNQFLSRMGYMNQYHAARKNQINQINRVRNLLKEKNELLSKRMTEQQELLESEKQENEQLAALRKRQSELILDLRKREAELKQQLLEQRRMRGQLGEIVSSNVAENSGGDKPQSGNKPSAEAEKMAQSFSAQKGRLSWPVGEGFISSKFGLQQHPVFENLQIDNIGVDIRTSPNQQVRAVFAGKVTAATKFTGMNYLVMVQHGTYFTVYANLEKVNVRIGDLVEAGDIMGTVFTNDKKIAELQFQIWRNDTKLDPEQWLKP